MPADDDSQGHSCAKPRTTALPDDEGDDLLTASTRNPLLCSPASGTVTTTENVVRRDIRRGVVSPLNIFLDDGGVFTAKRI